jgi:hypothetical protein
LIGAGQKQTVCQPSKSAPFYIPWDTSGNFGTRCKTKSVVRQYLPSS